MDNSTLKTFYSSPIQSTPANYRLLQPNMVYTTTTSTTVYATPL